MSVKVANFEKVRNRMRDGEWYSHWDLIQYFGDTEKNRKRILPCLRDMFVWGKIQRKKKKHRTRNQFVWYYKLN
jgi:hypothetical protein